MILFIVALLLLNVFFYEYRVIKGIWKRPIDITKAYGTIVMQRRYK